MQTPDPNNDRIVKSLPPPPSKPLTEDKMFDQQRGIPRWTVIRDHLKLQGRIAKPQLLKMLAAFEQIIKNEPNLILINDPVTIVGDIHGQYYDLLKLLEVGGNPELTKYLFLGDYVDRGSFSMQTLMLLMALKLNFPQTMYMLRGNHECRQMTSFFNFRTECLSKYDQQVYDSIMNCFDQLPITCILNNKFFCTHGGLSPELKTIDEVKRIDRFREIPRSGIFCDLMWADPVQSADGSSDTLIKPNDVRGCSYYFGFELSKAFLERNRLLSVIRAHQVQIQGYKMYKWNGQNQFPTVLSIFSAPNYCDVYNNKGAVIKFVNNTLNIQQFNYTPHPYLLPNFLDVFTWSIPFMAEKVTEMLYHMIKPDQKISQSELNVFQFVHKVKLVETLLNMHKSQKQKNISLVKLQGLCPDDKLLQIGVGPTLTQFRAFIPRQQQKQKFEQNKNIDLQNEKRPEKIEE